MNRPRKPGWTDREQGTVLCSLEKGDKDGRDQGNPWRYYKTE